MFHCSDVNSISFRVNQLILVYFHYTERLFREDLTVESFEDHKNEIIFRVVKNKIKLTSEDISCFHLLRSKFTFYDAPKQWRKELNKYLV